MKDCIPMLSVPARFSSDPTVCIINFDKVVNTDQQFTKKEKLYYSKLNEVMLDIITRNPPPAVKGKYIKIKFISQLPTHTPTFAFYCNLPQYIKEPYKRFLENKLRENFDFTGVPIQLFMRKK